MRRFALFGLTVAATAVVFTRPGVAADRSHQRVDAFRRAQEVQTARLDEASSVDDSRPKSAPTAEVVEIPADPLEREAADGIKVKSLRDVSINIAIEGEAPADVRRPGQDDAPRSTGNDAQRGFGETIFFWHASNMVHRPLYFEQRYVERYGYNFGLMQPVASGVQFYGDVGLLPLKMLRHPPCECVFSLGYDRPGDAGVRCPRH